VRSRLCFLAVLLVLAAPGTADAATLRLDPSAPPGNTAGTVWRFQVIVEREPGEPSRVPTVATLNRSTGKRTTAVARPTGEQDVYDATVTFDAPGTWIYEVASGNARVRDSIAIVTGTAGGSDSGWKLLALVSSAIALAALVAAALLLRRRTAIPSRLPAPARPAAAQPSADVARDRQALIDSYLYLYDIVRDDVLRDRLRQALAEAGVSELDSVGDRFDPSRHRATGRVPTDDPSLDGRIAEVERRGFSDRGNVLRMPDVLVYSVGAGARR
jgi:molecular chaperone GrpE